MHGEMPVRGKRAAPTDKEIAYNYYVGSDSAQVKIPAHAIQTLVH